jgi:LuxR family maltose regulon positive regulatory protein
MSAQEAVPSLPERLHDVRLVTKLHVPHLRPQLVHRRRLIEQLHQGMQATLILLSAPAGFGKTTLLAQWLAERERPSAWISLEPEDNDPVRFFSALIAALQRVDPQLGTSALACLHPSPPSPTPSPETVVALLISDLHQQAPRDFALVLDDYHVIMTEALHQALATLVEHAPAPLHLVIATRVDPALPLSRLRTRGQLYEVRADQLQFLPEETSTFLQAVMGLDLSVEERTVLQDRTEGWIAGLQLAALSLQGRSDVQQFLGEFTGSHRHIIDYLTEEVLARQPEAVQSFLLHTALLDRFTSPLCDAVTGRTDAEQMLGYLERANLFLVPLDERRQWYRYHHLFAEVLRARVLREAGTAGLAALYTLASAWYEQHGMLAEAVEAALSAGDFRRATRFIDSDSPLVRSMLGGYEARTLIGWLERFPQEMVFTDAHLCLVYAWSLGLAETSDAYEGPLAMAEQLFQAEGDRTRWGQASTLRALMAGLRGDTVQAIRFGTQAFDLLPEAALLERGVAASALAEGYRLGGEVAAASRMVTEARPLHEQTGDVASLLADTLVLGDLLVMEGRLHEAAAVYGSVLEAAGKRQSYTIRALIGLGNIARERNELDTAETHLGQAVTLASKIGDQVMLARAEAMRARAMQARGDAEDTRAAWASALKVAHSCKYLGLVEQAQAYQARGWLRQGRLEEATRWQQACPLAHDAPPNYQQEVMALTLVRVLLAQGEESASRHLLDRWYRHARAQGRTGSEMEMLMLSALIHAKQGKAEQAIQLLKQALLLASLEGYVQIFVDEGESMAVLLHRALSRWKGKNGADYVHRLLSVLQAEQPTHGSRSFTAPYREPLFEPLTARERKVLRGLSAGLSNAEIAASLVVSINTVKTQARSIYRKLNVKNRHEAVVTAQTWQLL